MKRPPLFACLATVVLLSAVVHSQNEGATIEPLLKNLTPAEMPPPEPMAAPDAFTAAPEDPAPQDPAPKAPAPENPAPADQPPPTDGATAPAPAPAPEGVATAPAPAIDVSMAEAAAPAPGTAAPASEIAAQPVGVTITAETDEIPPGVTETRDGMISVSFENLPMAEVINLFSQISGANIIAATTNLSGTVTASLKNVNWQPAFEAILSRHGLLLIEKPTGSGIFVVEAGLAGQEPHITDTINLRYAKVDKMAALINTMLSGKGRATPFPDGNAVLIQAPASKISEIRQIVDHLDRPRGQVYIEARFVEMSAAASKKLGLKWDVLKDWGVSTDSISLAGIATKGKLAQHKLQGSTRSSSETISEDDGEVPPRRESSSSESSDASYRGTHGIGYADGVMTVSIPEGSITPDVAWKYLGAAKGTLSADKFRLALSAFESEDGVSLISNPKIIVANEETAIVDMTTKEPYVLVESQRNTSGDGLTTQDINTKLGIIPGTKEGPSAGEAFFSYGVSLKVRPRVSSSGVITVMIEPSLSDRDLSQGDSGYYVIAGTENTPSTRYPIIRLQKINTTFSMLDGTTAVIGGLTRSSENNIDSGIPMLRKIPWIGPRLFGWKSRSKTQIEIIIFVTVGIVNPEEAMPENIGLPKNAILTRDFQEPGDRPREDFMRLKK